MGGYHIAEALKIPYFRAFTMTWSRTRLVPVQDVVRGSLLTLASERILMLSRSLNTR